MPTWVGKNNFANAIADCFDSARIKLFHDYQDGRILTSADGQNAFVQYYKSDILDYIHSTSPGAVTIIKQACSGSASVSPEWTWTFFSCPN